MGSTFLVRLQPKSHFPLQLQSDQIAGALLYAMGILYGQDLVSNQININNPPFQVSSAFPFFHSVDNNEVRCFPFPMIFPPKLSTKDYSLIKILKKAKFIEEGLFWNLITSKLSNEDLYQGVQENYRVLCSCLIPNETRIQRSSLETTYRSHNQINRLNSKSIQFFQSISSTFQNAGLYFILKVINSDWINYLKTSLEFLQDQGLGGNISTGQGWFNVSYDDYSTLPHFSSAEKHILLSLYSPKPIEIKNLDPSNSQYELIFRQSRSRNGKMRRSLHLFTPGSILSFHTPVESPIGTIRIVGNPKLSPFPAFVWSQALSVPWRLQA
ncbi:MAG: type III-A CRISPR-associated RAMP protein Csm4 [Candidatus Hodarchaeota archaeon]